MQRLHAFAWSGPLDQAALRVALSDALGGVAGHELVFSTDDWPDRPLDDAEVQRRLVRFTSSAPLHARLYRHGPQRGWLTLQVDSRQVNDQDAQRIVVDWILCYEARLKGDRVSPLRPEARLRKQGKEVAAEVAALFANPPAELGLFGDRLRPARLEGAAGLASALLAPDLAEALARQAGEERSSLEDWLLAAYAALLHRFGRQDDLIVAAGAPVRLFPSGKKPFASFARETGQARRKSLELGVAFDVVPHQAGYSFQDARTFPGTLGAASIASSPVKQPRVALDLDLRATWTRDGLALTLDFAAELFDDDTAKRFLSHFRTLLEDLAKNAAERLGRLNLMDDEARRQVLEAFNRTARAFPTHQTLHGLLEAQAKKSPHATALCFEDLAFTYQGFNAEANRLARHLRRLGVKKETLVGLCLDRTPDLIVAVFAILKAGGAYVPLDPSYPRERLGVMLDDAELSFLVTSSDVAAKLPACGARVVDLARDKAEIAAESPLDLEPGEDDARPEHLAYMIYTSGSTGKPKGVLVPHETVVNFLHAMREACSFRDDEVTLSANTISFDIVIPDLFLNFAFGGTLVLAPREASLDGRMVADLLARHQVTNMLATPSTWRILLDAGWEGSKDLRIIAAGEALPKPLAEVLQGLGKSVWNGYGPTEVTVIATFYQVLDLARPIFIGQPVANTFLYILDEHMQPVPVGVPGEVYIAGAGVTRGYLKREELTRERFVANPFSNAFGGRMYKTGDLARFARDGQVEYLGRNDDQVKIRGFRIELGDVETAVAAHPAIDKVVAMVREDEPGDVRLVVYYTTRAHQVVTGPDLRAMLKETVPSHMIPNHFVAVRAMPLNPNGKVDRRALPRPAPEALDLPGYRAPRRGIEKDLADLWTEMLRVPRVGVDDNFFELGGNSLLAVRMINRLKSEKQIAIPVLKLFQYPTIAGLAADFSGGRRPEPVKPAQPTPRPGLRRRRSDATMHEGIAIVGMACRFPGADSPAEFWQNLCDGRESITSFTGATLDPTLDPELVRSPDYVKARGIIRSGDTFDAAFFGISAREAEVMDPQHRLFLEILWEALEDSGHMPNPAYKIGVYAGTGTNTYFPEVVRRSPGLIERAGAFQVMVANEKDYLTTRAMHRLNLKGPAVNVQTACSTSLVAVHMAVQALRLGECEIAVAGGSSSTSPLNSGYLYQEGAMLSPDGHTRTFDEKAQGTVFSDGVGAVVLKRLSDAVRDGDTVHAVIIGTAINNDGAEKASFTAPSAEGQAEVIMSAMADAGIDAATVSYVEAHGTATPLGDPIEIEALTRAFRQTTDRKNFCAIGSVKSNVGHMTAAAGVGGLIKAALSLRHQKIPPSLHFTTPNPRLELASSPFFVNTRLAAWPRSSAPRRAGVSSFGVGGTNAHVVIEEAPHRDREPSRRAAHPIVLAAQSDLALGEARRRLAAHLERHPDVELGDVALTLANGRKAMSHRVAFVAKDVPEALRYLSSGKGEGWRAHAGGLRSDLTAFLFSGQGSQYPGMGLALYRAEPTYRQAFDECAEGIRKAGGSDLVALLHDTSEGAQARLTATVAAQPALFAMEFALSRLWASLGVEPDFMIGHSVGELVAATLAGIFGLDDALTVVVKRGQAMQSMARGAMLSVRAASETLKLPDDVALAAINSPSSVVVSGSSEAIERFAQALERQGIATRLLRTSHAFHSPMMATAGSMLQDLLSAMTLSPPTRRIISTVSGSWLTPEEATSPAYWARQIQLPVKFADAVRTGMAEGDVAWLEVGPRDVLATLTKQQLNPERRAAVVSTGSGSQQDEGRALLQAWTGLWLAGVKLDATKVYPGEARRRLPLPTYPFERQRHWPQVPASVNPHTASNSTVPTHGGPMSSGRKPRLIAELKQLLEDSSGIACGDAAAETAFLDLGLDSLFLTQFALKLQRRYGVKVTFRQLLEQYSSFDAVASLIDSTTPPDHSLPTAPATPTRLEAPAAVPQAITQSALQIMTTPAPASTPMQLTAQTFAAPAAGLDGIVAAQLQLMAKQLELLSGRATAPLQVASAPAAAPTVVTPAAAAAPRTKELYDAKKAFGAAARITYNNDASLFTPEQRRAYDDFVARYCAKTKESKRLTQFHRPHLADPRVVTGFRPAIKEVVYQIIMERSKGARMWDVDGNEYVDCLCGFGMNYFGWSPDFINDAVQAQMQKGIDIGPMTPLAGEVAKLLCDMTGFDRAGFCNTGSEAVLGCLRVARTVSGRDKVVLFAGSYHGIFDEVLVRGTKSGKAIPAAPGIMPSTAENVVVLDYGTPEALTYIKDHAHELAAVLCETIQSRRADFQPKEFLQEVRRITERNGCALIFDEVITGFRLAQGGAQEYFGIKADMASYGKVIGGGFPIGIIAGRKEWADALDGGAWKFGDDSKPEVGVTYFAGTFVRHPPALAAAKAVLLHLKEKGKGLQAEMNRKTEAFAKEMNSFFQNIGFPMHFKHMGSLYRATFTTDVPFGDLLFTWMRGKGLHIWDGFPCFFTTAHTDEDIAFIKKTFQESVAEMQAATLLPGPSSSSGSVPGAGSRPPVPGARLGRDPQGFPAWYVADPKQPGKYVKVN